MRNTYIRHQGENQLNLNSLETKFFQNLKLSLKRPLTPRVVDSSNSNSLDDAANVIIEDDIHISDNEITFKSFSDQVESENSD